MDKEKVNKATEIFERSNKEGTLRLTDETFQIILKKHLKASNTPNEIFLDEAK